MRSFGSNIKFGALMPAVLLLPLLLVQCVHAHSTSGVASLAALQEMDSSRKFQRNHNNMQIV